MGWLVAQKDATISIEKIPFPSSYKCTEDEAGATPPATLANGFATVGERVIGARLFPEDTPDDDTSVLGASKAITAGFFRSTVSR
ncbi:MAG: hypothetical protein J2P31_04060, partial [Blastocatellia bacterium]|nr:hypothetical protein [Blastocatellia bacterium]